MSDHAQPGIRSVLKSFLVGVVVILGLIVGLYGVLLVSDVLSSWANATAVFMVLNLAVIYAAHRMGTPRRRLIKIIGVGAVVTVVQPFALLAGWILTSFGYGVFVPLLADAVVAVVLAALRSKRGYAVAVALGTLNGLLAAIICLATSGLDLG